MKTLDRVRNTAASTFKSINERICSACPPTTLFVT